MATKKPKRYFIVNPAGAIHEVTYEHAQARLAQPGYRMAKAAEVRKLTAAGGKQLWDEPICEPFSTEPEAVEVDLD